MRTEIENTPTLNSEIELNSIISVLSDSDSTFSQQIAFLRAQFKNWFFYVGGHHLAIHERNSDGAVQDERIVIAYTDEN